MFYSHEWWYRTARKTLDEVPEADRQERMEGGAVVVFFHAEARDEEEEGRRASVLKKFLKNIKWLAGKFDCRQVVLHSFNHLSSSKSSAGFAASLLEEAAGRLEDTGYSVMVTPFGYFNEFRMHVAGDSLAKVFKEF